MIVDEIDIDSVTVLEPKDHAPVSTDRHTPEALQVASKRMKTKARGNHILGGLSGVETGQDTFDFVHKGGRYSPPVTVLEKTPQSAVPKADNHEPM